MKAIQVAMVNWTDLTDDVMVDGMRALQQQIDEDFAQAWGIDANLVLWPGSTRGPGYWGLILLEGDNPPSDWTRDQARYAYGRTTLDGYPLTKVFVHNRSSSQDWTHLASQQLLDMLVDPYRNAAVYREGGAPFRVYGMQVCDPCPAYSDGYERGGHIVSDFVCPAWFGGVWPDERLDVGGKMQQAFELLGGGSIRVVDPATSEWQVLKSDGTVGPPPIEATPIEPPSDKVDVLFTKLQWGP